MIWMLWFAGCFEPEKLVSRPTPSAVPSSMGGMEVDTSEDTGVEAPRKP